MNKKKCKVCFLNIEKGTMSSISFGKTKFCSSFLCKKQRRNSKQCKCGKKIRPEVSKCKNCYTKVQIGRKMGPRPIEWRKKIGDAQKGDKGHNWRGGVTPENKKARRSIEFKLWREAIFKRDNYTCQICNVRGVEIHPDHIKQFALYPELRYKLSNGRTLCVKCHKKTDTWGRNIPKTYNDGKYLTYLK